MSNVYTIRQYAALKSLTGRTLPGFETTRTGDAFVCQCGRETGEVFKSVDRAGNTVWICQHCVGGAGNERAAKDRSYGQVIKSIYNPPPTKQIAAPKPVTPEFSRVAGQLIAIGGAVKSLGETGWTYGGIGVYFGTPDDTDLQGEYFHTGTDFRFRDYDGVKRPVYYDHAKGMPDDPVGYVTDIEVTDQGLWFALQLDRSHKYARQVKALADKGALNFSTGSVPHLVKRSKISVKATRIDRWPLAEISLTPTPAQPGKTQVGRV